MIRIPAIMQIALDCSSKVVGIPTLEKTAHDLQMVYYWWRDADQQLRSMNSSDKVLVEGQARYTQIGPVLIGLPAQLNFISTELAKLAEETQQFVDEHSLPPKVQYKVEQGYNKVMEALYNNEIAKVYLGDAKSK